MVATVRGSFQELSGVLQLDGEQPENSTAEVTIQTASIDTGNADRDGHLRSADFFDVEKWPVITFTSTSARAADDDEYVLTGDLTVRDVTRQVELKVVYLGSST